MTPTLPPRDAHPERCLIAELLTDPDALRHVPADLDPSDFADHRMAEVYQALRLVEASGERPTIHMIAPILARRGQSLAPVAAELLELARSGVRGHASYHAGLIRDQATRQRFAQLAIDLLEATNDESPIAELAAMIESRTAQCRAASMTGRTLYDAGLEVLANLRSSDPPAAIWTGLQSLDHTFGGWCGGELVTIGAPTGCGKSAFALGVAIHNAEFGRPALIFSAEMRDVELATRALCGVAGVDSRRLRAGVRNEEEINALETANEESIRGRDIEVYDAAARTVEEIAATVRYERAKREGVVLVVVDYVQIVRATDPRADKRHQVAHVTQGLKALAQRENCVVLALSQLNREGALQGARLERFADSASIERDSDICATIERTDDDTRRRFSYLKFRAGECGAVLLRWDGVRTRFDDVTPEPIDFGATFQNN